MILTNGNVNRNSACCLILILLIWLPVCTQAADQPPQPVEPAAEQVLLWQGSVELGLMMLTGNASTQVHYSSGRVIHDHPVWRTIAMAFANVTWVDQVKVMQYFSLFSKTDYKLEQSRYLYVSLEYENALYLGYRHRATGKIGYGREWVVKDKREIYAEAGLGSRQTHYNDMQGRVGELLLDLSGRLKYSFNTQLRLEQTAAYEGGEKTSIYKSETALIQTMLKNFSLKTSIGLNYTTSVPADVAHLDTESRVTLFYDF